MNFIQENTDKVDWHTSLRHVEHWLGISWADYDWHFADVDGDWPIIRKSHWITGHELKQRVTERDNQILWAVISAFPKGTTPFTSNIPYGDGNPDFWNGKAQKQLPEALFELVCWDGTATLFIDLPSALEQQLLLRAPGIQCLNKQQSTKLHWRLFKYKTFQLFEHMYKFAHDYFKS